MLDKWILSCYNKDTKKEGNTSKNKGDNDYEVQSLQRKEL